MRMPALILTVLAATLLMAPASPQDRVNLSPKERVEESAKKVKGLQKERIATLKQMVDLDATLEGRGIVPFDEVIEARLLLLNAELDAAEKESDRVPLYKNIVDELKKYETFAERRVKLAQVATVSVLKARARRLEAEINLERARAKEAQEAK
jgi:hypothetical protein